MNQSRRSESTPAVSAPAVSQSEGLDTSSNSANQTEIAASGAQECGVSPEAEAARAAFNQFFFGVHTQTNYVTANGYGAFDLTYIPMTRQSLVIVNVELDFQPAPASMIMS